MTTTRAKSKKVAPDICSEISNKISTKKALSVVEATRQNVLEVFPLPSNCNKLLLVATETTSLSLAGFSPVKVFSKRHTWISLSVVSTPTKSLKVFNNRPVNKLIFPFMVSISDAASTSSSKKMVKRPKVQKNEISVASSSMSFKMGQDQPLAVLPNVVSSGRSSPVLKAKQSPSGGSSVLGNWADQMETESSLPLVSGATSGSAWETITNHQRFAGTWFFGCKVMSLEAAFLVELTSSVHLATFKIAKSLVISESGSPFTAVMLHDVLLDVFAANIKTALSVFGSVTHVVLKSAGVWQYMMIYFEKLDSAVSALNHWSVLVSKDSIRILPLVNQNETILSHDKFKTKLVNLFSGCTAFKISDIISQVVSGYQSWFALITFGSQAYLDSAIVKTSTLRKCHIWWKTPGCWCCFKCQEMSHLAADCKISPPFLPKLPKVFTLCFVGPKSYTKASVSLSSSGFPPLLLFVSSSVVVGDSLLSVLVEFIVKPIGFLVAIFEQFINDNLVLSNAFSLKINEVLVHMSSFSKTVSKLEREVVFLKKECCIEDINMFGDLELSLVVSDKVFSNLMSLWEHKSVVVKTDSFKTAKWLVGLVSCSATLFSVIQKMLSLDKFSSVASA
ncbi:hypothetical protein G9A89_006187 [Geosiphon pyriformis]|nr:hypothetical protein G9A89_006187 [Geosiphon pyriformis]